MQRGFSALFEGSISFQLAAEVDAAFLQAATSAFASVENSPQGVFVSELILSATQLPHTQVDFPLGLSLGVPPSDAEWQNGLELAASVLNRSGDSVETLYVTLPPEGDLAVLFRDLRGFREIEVVVGIPDDRDLSDTLAAIAETEWLAAGILGHASERVAPFLAECMDLELECHLSGPFRTAITQVQGDALGYLNALGGAAIARHHDLSRREFVSLLQDPDPKAWEISGRGISYRGLFTGVEEIEETRDALRGFSTDSLSTVLDEIRRLGN